MAQDFEEMRSNIHNLNHSRKNGKDDEQIRINRQAAHLGADANFVTGTPQWDHILNLLNEELVRANAARDAIQASMLNVNIVDPQVILKMRQDALLLGERIGLLGAIIMFPKQLIELGEASKLKLSEAEAEDE